MKVCRCYYKTLNKVEYYHRKHSACYEYLSFTKLVDCKVVNIPFYKWLYLKIKGVL